MNFKSNFNRTISGILSLAMTATVLPCFPVSAEDSVEKYPYTMFAASDAEGAITVNAGNFCVNGSVATNGTIVSSGNTNINGTRTEQANEEMLYIFDKIDSKYFTGSNVEEYTEDYILEEMNININNPVEVEGDATLTGNININSALKALENVELYGEVKNTNDSLIFSKYGDIIIESQNVNLNGLVYAPFGDVVITAQNLNLNNVVIIADTITFECPSVNANYSSGVAEFAGSVSDPLNIPFEEYKYLLDSDEDGLPDIIESQIGTDADNADTDGDELPDGYEMFETGTDPKLSDTDVNDIADGDEDLDKDGLTNYEEYVNNADPWQIDSDDDSLNDEDEVNNYGTNPAKKDTDDDGLEDAEEVYLGLDPLNPDSDGDGILDGDERFEQTIEQDICVDDDKIAAITKVSVTFNCPGVIDNQVTLENMYNVDVLSSNVVGMVGAPIDITSSVDFDNATITFNYDEALLNGTPEENLAILWYDETNDRYVILDEDTVVDVENNTVSYTTTHFSTYLVIDREVWYDCWRENIDYRNSPIVIETAYDISFVVDVSGSMAGDRLDRAKTALNTFIDAMYPCDNACLVKFDDYGSVVSKYGSSISELKSAVSSLYASGGTSTNSGLSKALEELSPNLSDYKTAMIILICDGDVEYNVATMVLINKAIINNIAIHTINVCDSASSILSEISEKTGGTYYIAKNSSEIASVMATLQQNTVSSIDMTDSDGDGLYDVYEVNGMKIQNGQIIKTDPYTADSDNDGMSDFDEIGGAPVNEVVKFFKSEYSCVLFEFKSNPLELDSDGDLDIDSIDPHPFIYKLNDCFIDKISDLEDLAYSYNDGKWDWLMKFTIDKEYWLSFMFIRHFANGEGEESNYVNSSNWSVAGGEIENEFVNYVYNHDLELYQYFENTNFIYANASGDLVDLKHLAATATVYIYKSDLLDSKYFSYEDYEEWYHFIKNLKIAYRNGRKRASTELFEHHFDNLGGWAGDLQTLMVDNYIYSDYDSFYSAIYNSIGDKSFKFDDLYADVDAYNVFVILEDEDEDSLKDAFSSYYDSGYNKRFTSFTNDWDEDRISDLVYIYTKNNYLGKIHWPLFERDGVIYNFSKEQSKAARDAFVDFLMERINNE